MQAARDFNGRIGIEYVACRLVRFVVLMMIIRKEANDEMMISQFILFCDSYCVDLTL